MAETVHKRLGKQYNRVVVVWLWQRGIILLTAGRLGLGLLLLTLTSWGPRLHANSIVRW